MQAETLQIVDDIIARRHAGEQIVHFLRALLAFDIEGIRHDCVHCAMRLNCKLDATCADGTFATMSTEAPSAPKKVNLRRPEIMEAVQAQVISHYRSELVERIRAHDMSAAAQMDSAEAVDGSDPTPPSVGDLRRARAPRAKARLKPRGSRRRYQLRRAVASHCHYLDVGPQPWMVHFRCGAVKVFLDFKHRLFEWAEWSPCDRRRSIVGFNLMCFWEVR